MKTITSVVIGGSNTVMRSGYLSMLQNCLRGSGLDLDISLNLAIGNTTIQTGLMKLVENLEILKEADLLLIEYTLNDTSVYSKSLQGFQRWLKYMEGAIRLARSVNPSIKIVPLVFASRTGVHRQSLNILHAGVQFIAKHYGITSVDVNANLVRRFGPGVFEAPSVYGDTAHYQRPIFTTIVAEIISEQISAYLHESASAGDLPNPIDVNHYGGAKVILSGDLDKLPTEGFKNKVYDVVAVDLGKGAIDIEIDGGTLLAANYVCTDDISHCYVCANGQWYQLATMQPSMEEPKFKFLLSTMSFDDIPIGEGISKYTLTGQAPTDETVTALRQHGSRKPVRPEKRLPVISILHTGTLISCTCRAEIKADLQSLAAEEGQV